MISTTRSIPAPPAEVYAALADVAHWPDWLDTVDELHLLDGAASPPAVGDRATIRQPRLPKATWTVTEVEPGHHFTWESKAPGLRFVGHHLVEPDGDGGSRVTLGIDQQGPLRGLARALWGRLTQEYVEREGACLEKRVLGGPHVD
jgi:uncharacterized protein YndB with AHSA1/START domain